MSTGNGQTVRSKRQWTVSPEGCQAGCAQGA